MALSSSALCVDVVVPAGSAATLVDYPFHAADGGTLVNVGTLGAPANGVLFGGAAYSTDTPGGTGHSIRIPASGGGVDVADAWNYGSAMTIEAWIKPANISVQSILWDDYGNPGVVLAVRPALTGPLRDVLQLSLSTSGNPGSGLTVFGGEIITGEWQHVAGVYDGVMMSLYHNGALVGQLANSGPVFDNSGFSAGLGTENLSHGLNFNGWIDDFRIHNVALESGQLAAGAFAEVPEPATVLTGVAVLAMFGVRFVRRRSGGDY